MMMGLLIWGLVSVSLYSSEAVSVDMQLMSRGLFTAYFYDPKPFGSKESALDKMIPNIPESKFYYGFSLARLHIDFLGHQMTRSLRYRTKIAFEGAAPSLLDMFVDYDLSEFVRIRFGQYKVPFLREELAIEDDLEFAWRSVVNQYFTLGRDIGGTVTIGPKNLKFNLGMFTGWGRGYMRVDSVSMNRNLIYAGRLEFIPVGKLTYTQANLRGERLVNVGLAGLFMAVSQEEIEAKKIGARRDKSEVLREIENKASKTDLISACGDVKVWWDRFSFETEMSWAEVYDSSFFGLRVQPSYMLMDKLVLALRLASVFRENLSPVYEPGLSLSYYFKDFTYLRLEYINRRDPKVSRDRFAYLSAQFQIQVK